jgi:hypothetical protein
MRRVSPTPTPVEQRSGHGHIPCLLRLPIEVGARACEPIAIAAAVAVDEGAPGAVQKRSIDECPERATGAAVPDQPLPPRCSW